jgi:hypothetical protein
VRRLLPRHADLLDGRIEVPGGDLHENGGLDGKLLDADEARALI